MDGEEKKYNQIENVLQRINKDYISLPESDVKRNNKILEQATERLTTLMKDKDTLFRNMYERKFYGGSFYDGIKVEKPEEYDLDYVLNLPLIIEPVLEAAKDKPGFVHIRITEYMKLLKREEAPKFAKLDALMDGSNYLSTSNVLSWVESIISLALKELELVPDKGYKLDIKLSKEETIPVYATLSKTFPAFTLRLKNSEAFINLDIDLVPCFQFTKESWPKEKDGYRQNTVATKNKFLVVPKKPPLLEKNDCPTLERYWRLSFQEQERELITGHEFKSMKPTIKMLKKLRDTQKHKKIASYYIKTIFLWEAQRQPKDLWKKSLSYVVMVMLRKYAEMVQSKCIPYFWNQQYNLIGHIKDVTLTDIGKALQNIISDVEKNLMMDPFIIAEYLIGKNESNKLRSEVDLGKKHIKKLKSASLIMGSPSPSTASQDEPDTSRALSEEEKVRKLILNEEFLREVAEHMSKYLRPKLQSTVNADGGDSFRQEDATNKIMKSLDDLHDKTDGIANMMSSLTDRVSSLESSFSDLNMENSRLRTELRRAQRMKEPRSFGDLNMENPRIRTELRSAQRMRESRNIRSASGTLDWLLGFDKLQPTAESARPSGSSQLGIFQLLDPKTTEKENPNCDKLN